MSDIPVFKPGTKRESFFYGLIVADFFGYRSFLLDADTDAVAAQIEQETGRNDGGYLGYYARLLKYTSEMYFDFTDDVPEEYRSLETWWNKVKAGEPTSEVYLWFAQYIPNPVFNDFVAAMERAHRVWKPVEQKAQPPEGNDDPNLPSAKKRSVTKSASG